MTSTTAPTWTWAVTVTTPDGQIAPVITPNTFSDCTRAGENAAKFLEILGENTEFEAFANSVAKSIRLISCPEGAAPAQSVYAGIYSAHIMPVAPGQSPQQAWEQHMPPTYVRRLTTALPSPAARAEANAARVAADKATDAHPYDGHEECFGIHVTADGHADCNGNVL